MSTNRIGVATNMGEAKRRREFNLKFNRGLVISPPIEYGEHGLFVEDPRIDAQELRFALFFWDRLAWPQNELIGIPSGPEEEFLESAGVLTRPMVRVQSESSEIAEFFGQEHIQAFMDLDRREPGA